MNRPTEEYPSKTLLDDVLRDELDGGFVIIIVDDDDPVLENIV